MSTLWTPGGEVPVRPESSPSSPPSPQTASDASEAEAPLSDEEIEQRMRELQDEVARTPVEVVIANHAVGLFELARLHLILEPPQLDQARLAIDAFAYLVEGLGERLGSPAKELASGLSQLRMAYVQKAGGPEAP